MTHLVVQFHNLEEGREAEYDRHLQRLPRQLGLGLIRLQRYRLSPNQFPGPLAAVQPYGGVTLFEIDDTFLPDRQAILAECVGAARSSGLLAEDRTHLFHILCDRMPSVLREPADAPEHLVIVMGNYMPGMREEWGTWYDEVHGPEGLACPGIDAYSRGVLADTQLDPQSDQPATGLVMLHFTTFDVPAAIAEFMARGAGTSATGIRWAPRSPAVGPNTTLHGFDPVGPHLAGPQRVGGANILNSDSRY